MSLVDKLDGVHIGDLIHLDGQRAPVVGYVQGYSMDTITLGIELPFHKISKDIRKVSFMGKVPTTIFGNPSKRYHLKYFDSYEVLKKYSGEENKQNSSESISPTTRDSFGL